MVIPKVKITGARNTTVRLYLIKILLEVIKMDYGDIGGNEFRDDEPELNNQLVFVEDEAESSGELVELLGRYE